MTVLVRKPPTIWTLGTSAAALGLVMCQAPTEVEIVLTTNVPCVEWHDVTVSLGHLGSDVEGKPPVTSATTCHDDGSIGTLVIQPSGAKDEEVVIKVTGGVGRDASTCASNFGVGCIVARRAIHFVPHTPLTLPIALRRVCDGVNCSSDQTCDDTTGVCRPAAVPSCADPNACTLPGVGLTDAGNDVETPSPIRFVQANAGTNSASTSLTVEFPSPVTAHATIIVALDWAGPMSAPIISDTLGNTYTVVVAPPSVKKAIAVAYDARAGTDSVTVRVNGATGYESYIVEYAGLATASAFDVSQFGTGFGASDVTDAAQCPFASTNSGRELIFGFGASDARLVPGTGFTLRSDFNGNLVEDKIVDVAGSYQATATMMNGTSGSSWTILMATFRGQ